MKSTAIATLGGFLMLAATACDATGTVHEFRDEGKICAFPGSEANGVPGFDNNQRSYREGEAVAIAVQFPTCLSSSCSTDRQADCTVSLNGSTLHVTSSGSFRQRTTGACTDDCGFLIARCTTPPLPAGVYTVEHGGASTTLTIPSTAAPACAGSWRGQ